MSRNRIFLLVVGLFALLAAVLGWINYFQGNFSGVSWPFVWLGIFIWGDGMVLGAFLAIGSAVLWFKNNATMTGLFFSAYVLLRSLIEVIYNVVAQFSPIVQPWEQFLPQLAATLHLQIVELHVVAQIGYTAICVVALVVFVGYIREYLRK